MTSSNAAYTGQINPVRPRSVKSSEQVSSSRTSLLPGGLSLLCLLLGLSQFVLLHLGQTPGASFLSRGTHSCPQRQRQPTSMTLPIFFAIGALANCCMEADLVHARPGRAKKIDLKNPRSE